MLGQYDIGNKKDSHKKNGVDSVNRLTKKIHEAFVNHVNVKKKEKMKMKDDCHCAFDHKRKEIG